MNRAVLRELRAMPIVFTDHALMRYERRLRQPATSDTMRQVVADGTVRLTAPRGYGEGQHRGADAWLVTPDAVFPLLRNPHGQLVAVTCMRRQRLPKADRRARRDLARDDQHWGITA